MKASKRQSLPALVRLLKRKRAGKRLVFTNGCFDLLHPGHIHLLTFARRQGDILVVGMNSDRSVRCLQKGSGRPIQSEKDRAEMLSAVSAVDYVTLFHEETPETLIRTLHPDVLVKGADWKRGDVVGRSFVESYGGRYRSCPRLPGKSTTKLLRTILQKVKKV